MSGGDDDACCRRNVEEGRFQKLCQVVSSWKCFAFVSSSFDWRLALMKRGEALKDGNLFAKSYVIQFSKVLNLMMMKLSGGFLARPKYQLASDCRRRHQRLFPFQRFDFSSTEPIPKKEIGLSPATQSRSLSWQTQSGGQWAKHNKKYLLVQRHQPQAQEFWNHRVCNHDHCSNTANNSQIKLVSDFVEHKIRETKTDFAFY